MFKQARQIRDLQIISDERAKKISELEERIKFVEGGHKILRDGIVGVSDETKEAVDKLRSEGKPLTIETLVELVDEHAITIRQLTDDLAAALDRIAELERINGVRSDVVVAYGGVVARLEKLEARQPVQKAQDGTYFGAVGLGSSSRPGNPDVIEVTPKDGETLEEALDRTGLEAAKISARKLDEEIMSQISPVDQVYGEIKKLIAERGDKAAFVVEVEEVPITHVFIALRVNKNEWRRIFVITPAPAFGPENVFCNYLDTMHMGSSFETPAKAADDIIKTLISEHSGDSQ